MGVYGGEDWWVYGGEEEVTVGVDLVEGGDGGADRCVYGGEDRCVCGGEQEVTVGVDLMG